ncbi:unnamed protein product [Spirodela intermedia]|uniref:separase n=1 Tax=Spirodela intermedia TaxID=51605 RepID=A0A7I8KUR6_SPIIN|nr:unnamed protein product [Spirodela intermedia]
MGGSSAAAVEESSVILSMLEKGVGNGDGSFCRRVASFLHPFGDLIPLDSHCPAATGPNGGGAAPAVGADAKKKKKNSAASSNQKVSEKGGAEAAVLRPLAKQFLPFLSRALKLLPSVLRKCPREEENWAGELFGVYRIVLDCLWFVSPCLAGRPFAVHLQRCSFLCCLEIWGKYSEAEEEGVSLLESLVSVVSSAAPEKSHKGRKAKGTSSGSLLPDSTAKGACDVELAILVTEVVVCLMRCAYKSKRKTDTLYRRVLLMVGEVQPWLRFLESKDFEKYHLSLVSALGKCALFLAGECMSFDAALVHNFCVEMSREWLISFSKDQFPKIARQVCSSISLQWESRFVLMLDMMKCLLDSISCKCKDNMVHCANQFLEFVHYVIDTCQTASTSIQRTAYELLIEWRINLQEVSPSVASILGFYAIGLGCRGRTIQIQHREAISRTSNDAPVELIYDTEYLQIFGDSLGILDHNSHSSVEEFRDTLVRCLRKVSSLDLGHKISISCGCVHGEVSFFSYLDALGFLCKQLEDYVNTTWKDMISEAVSLHSADICYVLEAFYQFCVLFLSEVSDKSDKEKLLESRLVLFHVVVASLKLCFVTSKDSQRIVTLINHVISCEWIKAQELKYLVSSFYNIGASLYNAGQVEKASIALQLCCTASWAHIKLLCQLLQEDVVIMESDNLSESMMKDATMDACAKSAVALDVIHQCGDVNLRNIAVDCILSWSTVEESLGTSTCPFALVKQWIKIVCKDYKDVDAVDSVPVLCLLLSSKCATLPKRIFGIILEQELLAYEEFNAKYPNLCQSMQLRLMDMLLKEVYVEDEYVLHRSKILVKKGRALRTCGVDGLNSSLQCLSEAISLLEVACSDASRGNSLLYYQLALTYFLLAHCAQEANEKVEVILNDISSGLRWWSSISKDTYLDLEYEKTIQLLCSVADLSALKGHLRFQLEMCRLIALLCKRNNVPLESCVDMLWSNRRLSHECCSSPLDEIFIRNMSEEFGVCANSISFWISCMKSSHSTLVGFLQGFFLSNAILMSENTLCSHITVQEVKRTASSLISSGSVTSRSAFAAGYLLFDLSERLLQEGHISEALSHAREALRLRKRILQRRFISVRQQPGKVETIWNNELLFTEAIGSIVTEDWPNFTKPLSSEDCTISPWSVLKCYLQSILQVGIIYESIGNGAEAEILFRLGKTISCSLGFPIFGIAFSSHIGQVYRKKQLLDLTENELGIARRILVENAANISCKRCEVVLEGLIDLQLGDLYRSKFESTSGIKCIESLTNALSQYKSALEKLNLVGQSSFGSCVGTNTTGSLFGKGFISKVTHEAGLTDKVLLPKREKSSTMHNECDPEPCYIDDSDRQNVTDDKIFSVSTVNADNYLMDVGGKREPKFVPRRSSRKKVSDGDSNLSTCNIRTHCKKRNVGSGKYQNIPKHASCTREPTCPGSCQKDFGCLEHNEKLQSLNGRSEASLNSNKNCWGSFLVNVMKTDFMNDIMFVKWECHRRLLSLRLLSKIGKCMKVHSRSHEVHEIFWQSMSLLFDSGPLSQSGACDVRFLEVVGMENLHDIFPIQRAVLLYDMSLFCVKDCFSEGSRRKCCSLSKPQISSVLSWLFTAFILAQELPLLFQKICRLIAAIISLSMSTGHFSLPFSFESLTESHLAAFFHQASVGTNLQHMCVSNMKGVDIRNQVKGSIFALERLSDLEKFVNTFFNSLPSFTVVCISLLGGDYVNLLGETLLLPSFFPAWMLLSRLDPKGLPIVMLLPVDFVPEEIHDDASGTRITSTHKEPTAKWECPWGHTLVDHVVPQYKLILEENYISLSQTTCDAMDTQRNRFMWWSERSRLNSHLSIFLRRMEDSWLGSWRCLLLGERADVKNLDAVLSKLSRCLKSECKLDANMSVLQAIVGGSQSVCDIETCISQMVLYKGYLGRGRCCGAESFRVFSSAVDGGAEIMSESTRGLILEAVSSTVQEPVDREPIVLVLDSDLQMLPWENLPILRKEEVYRMPSMSSISVTLARNFQNEESERLGASIPSVDPLDAYYLLNPSGDLSSTQMEFEEWFRNQKWQGKAGKVPTSEELIEALQNHDLFLYFGHGSGTQYIPGNAIQKVDHCAATLLMGCSSGSLFLRGCYAPHGAPLSYLLAGSPAVIANLWEVSDKDIDRFGKAMLNSWLQESTTADHTQSNNRTLQDSGHLHAEGGSTKPLKTRRKSSKDQRGQTSKQDICGDLSKNNRIASFMSQARDACKLPQLIGASPVCYGVPTLIRRNQKR